MNHRGILALCLSALPLVSQGYETKFKAVGFKPGDVYHTEENVNVSLTGGSVEITLPLGPALAGPIALRPVIRYHGKYSQGLNPGWDFQTERTNCWNSSGYNPGVDCDAVARVNRRWSQPSLPQASLGPGKLVLSHGAFGSNGQGAPIQIDSPLGRNTSYWFDQAGVKIYSTQAQQAELDGLVSSLAPEWTRTSIGNTQGSPVLAGIAGVGLGDGSILVFGPSNATVYNRYYAAHEYDVLSRVPDEILQVGSSELILWQRSRHTMQTVWDRKDWANGTMYDYYWNGTVYHPVWIKSRSGFKVFIDVFRDAAQGTANILTGPGVLDSNGISKPSGLLKGWEVYYRDSANAKVGYRVDRISGYDYSATYFGMGNIPATTGIGASGRTPARRLSASSPTDPYWQPGTTEGWYGYGGDQYDLDYESGELSAGFSALTQGALTTTFDWSGPYGLLAKMTSPQGKTYSFQYEIAKGLGPRPPTVLGNFGGWNHSVITPGLTDYWSVVTQMDISDDAGTQVRSTRYRWAIPQPNAAVNSPGVDWLSTAHGVAQTLPDGQTILHVFGSPVQGTSFGADPMSNVDYKASSVLAVRQTTVGRYHYKTGDSSWQGFFSGSDPDSTTWVKRERMEGWDFRNWNSALFEPNASTEPRPSRTIMEQRAWGAAAGGPVSVQEMENWDPVANEYHIQRTYALPAGNLPPSSKWAPGVWSGASPYFADAGLQETPRAGALFHQIKATTFAPPQAGLFNRPQKIESSVRAAGGDATGQLPTESYEYDPSDPRAHLVTKKVTTATDGSGAKVELGFSHAPSGLFTDRLTSALLSGASQNQASSGSHSGEIGAQYEYDPSGRWMTKISPKGVAWFQEEPSHDEMGRPTQQKDPNGIPQTFAWDYLGRLTQVTPLTPEVVTAVTYPDFGGKKLRQATLTRGAITSRYYYNAHGELIGEDRLGAGGAYSHKTYAYDTAGRKVFDSVWRPNAFSTTVASDWTTPGVETVQAAYSQERCTATHYDPDLGERVCIAWTTDNFPAVLQALGGTTSTFDEQGRPSRTTSPNGEVIETRYDVNQNPLLTQQVRAPGTSGQVTTTFERNAAGRLVNVTDALGQNTHYAYDQAGRIVQVTQTDPLTLTVQTRNWVYDGLGRLVVLDQPESGVTYYTSFTVTGKATETVYGLPRAWRPADVNSRSADAFSTAGVKVLSTVFDTLDRPTRITGPGVDQTFTYDSVANGKGKLGSAVNNGATRGFEYLGLNGRPSKLTRTVDGLTFIQSLGYDNYGRLKSRTYPDGKIQLLTLDDPSSLATAMSFGGTSLGTYGYDPATWSPTQISYANGATSSFTYRMDQVGLKTMAHAIPGKLSKTWNYSYNERGLLTTDGEDSYTYDPLDRLTTAFVWDAISGNQGLVQQFTYDAFGNRKTLDSKAVTNWTVMGSKPISPITTSTPKAETYGLSPSDPALAGRNQLPATTLGGAPTGALYDLHGNLTRVYAKVGNSATQLTMSYDALGRVATLGDSANLTNQTYLHDDEGLRLKIFDSKTNKSTYNVYNESRQLIAIYEKVGTGALTWKRDILYLGTKEMAEVAATGTEVTLVDHLGSPRYGWKGGTTPLLVQKFLPFGESLGSTANAANFAKGFTNHEQTDPSGLIYMQARFYAPWYGRFLSPDPALDQHFQDTQSWNIYSYVMNNPTMKIDPTGMVAGDFGDWVSSAYDSALDGAARIHVGLQQLPIVGGAYAAGARLGEAISGERVNANGTTTQLSLDERSTAAFEGTKGMAPLVAGGGLQMALPGGIPVPTGSTITPGGSLVLTTATANAGNVAGVLAIPAVASANNGPRSGSSKNEKHGDSGRAQSKADKQVEKLQNDLKNAKTRSEKRFLEQKIKNIQKAAEKAKKGEEHSRGAKG